MVHRMTVAANPRLLALFVIVLAMAALAIVAFALLGALFGVIFLALAAFLGYQFSKFAAAHLRSRIVTAPKGISFVMPTSDREEFPWEKVSLSGYCTRRRGKPFLFVYNESDDRLITVPREYSDFNALVEEVKARSAFELYALASGETIQDVLRARMGIDPPSKN